MTSRHGQGAAWSLAGLVLVWYVANLGFNVGMKRSHALVPDVLVLTAFQFGAGAIAYGIVWLAGYAKLPQERWAVPLAGSAVLLLCGTLHQRVAHAALPTTGKLRGDLRELPRAPGNARSGFLACSCNVCINPPEFYLTSRRWELRFF